MKRFSLHDIIPHIGKESFFSDIFEGEKFVLEISYLSQFQNTQYLRDVIEALSDFFRFNAKWRARLILFCDELNNNAIEYGSLPDDENIMRIEFNASTKIFRLSIEDTGSGPGTKTAEEMEKLRKQKEKIDFSQHHSIRGRGLYLIISPQVDTLFFSDNPKWGLTVGFEKKFSPEEFEQDLSRK